jgi:hypothetical protein
MIDDEDSRTAAQADADWHEATHRLFGSSSTVTQASPVVSSPVLPPPAAKPDATVLPPPAATPPYLPDVPTTPGFAVGEAIHYLTWGLQGGTITAIYKLGKGYNPHDSSDLLYLIALPPSSHADDPPLLVPATLLRKIPANAPPIPIHLPTGLSLDGRTWTEEAQLIMQSHPTPWVEDQVAGVGYTTEEDDDDDADLFSQSWLENQIAEETCSTSTTWAHPRSLYS